MMHGENGNISVPAKELGGFTVTVSDIACAIPVVGPERLVFWMPVNAPLGDYSAIVNTPTGMKTVALHVVEAAPDASLTFKWSMGILLSNSVPNVPFDR